GWWTHTIEHGRQPVNGGCCVGDPIVSQAFFPSQRPDPASSEKTRLANCSRLFRTISYSFQTTPPCICEESAMRWLLTLVLFLGLAMSLTADTFVYVSMAPEQKIQVFRLDPKDGKLTAVEATAVDGTPGSLGVDPKKQLLLASLRSNSTLASFRIDPT